MELQSNGSRTAVEAQSSRLRQALCDRKSRHPILTVIKSTKSDKLYSTMKPLAYTVAKINLRQAGYVLSVFVCLFISRITFAKN